MKTDQLKARVFKFSASVVLKKVSVETSDKIMKSLIPGKCDDLSVAIAGVGEQVFDSNLAINQVQLDINNLLIEFPN